MRSSRAAPSEFRRLSEMQWISQGNIQIWPIAQVILSSLQTCHPHSLSTCASTRLLHALLDVVKHFTLCLTHWGFEVKPLLPSSLHPKREGKKIYASWVRRARSSNARCMSRIFCDTAATSCTYLRTNDLHKPIAPRNRKGHRTNSFSRFRPTKAQYKQAARRPWQHEIEPLQQKALPASNVDKTQDIFLLTVGIEYQFSCSLACTVLQHLIRSSHLALLLMVSRGD